MSDQFLLYAALMAAASLSALILLRAFADVILHPDGRDEA